MKYTKKELIELVNKKSGVGLFADAFFARNRIKNKTIEVNGKTESLYTGEDDFENEFAIAYDQNWGDGNDWQVALHFPEEDINILLDGYYSSQGDSEFQTASLSLPYDYTEIRYRPVTQQDIRDMKIDEVIIDTEKN